MATLRPTSTPSSPSSYSPRKPSSIISEDTSKQKPRPVSSTKWSFRTMVLVLCTFSLGWLGFGAIYSIKSHYREPHAGASLSVSLSPAVEPVEIVFSGPRVHPVTGQAQLDFLVAGFPKCGTTTLLYAFRKHASISIDKRENCLLARPVQQDDVNLRLLNESLAELDDGTGKLKSMKCPDTLNNFKTIHRLSQHSPDCHFVIGIRHPIKMLQSFYNYRVTEIYDKNLTDPIPDLLDLVSGAGTLQPWKDVSLDSGRFELKLMQFAKTNMTIQDFEKLQDRHSLAVKPNRFRIFLYALEQINDSDADRSAEFRHDLQGFLGLPTPIQTLGQENVNRFVGSHAHRETVDLCDAHFDSIRDVLVENSRQTAMWIIHQFITSPDVMVSNRKFFTHILEDWTKDPCRPKRSTLRGAY